MVGGLMLSRADPVHHPGDLSMFDRLSLHLKRRFPRQEEEA